MNKNAMIPWSKVAIYKSEMLTTSSMESLALKNGKSTTNMYLFFYLTQEENKVVCDNKQ